MVLKIECSISVGFFRFIFVRYGFLAIFVRVGNAGVYFCGLVIVFIFL